MSLPSETQPKKRGWREVIEISVASDPPASRTALRQGRLRLAKRREPDVGLIPASGDWGKKIRPSSQGRGSAACAHEHARRWNGRWYAPFRTSSAVELTRRDRGCGLRARCGRDLSQRRLRARQQRQALRPDTPAPVALAARGINGCFTARTRAFLSPAAPCSQLGVGRHEQAQAVGCSPALDSSSTPPS